MKRYFLFLTLILGALSAGAAERVQLQFVADLNVATGVTFQDTEVGGLSGAYYDDKTHELYALSDDKGEKSPPRIYAFSLEIDESGAKPVIRLVPKRTIFLRMANGQTFPKGAIDPEGIAPSPRGFYISQEGNFNTRPRLMPSVFEVSADGRAIRPINVPAKFLPNPEGELTQGVRSNTAFEGLTFHTEKSEITPLIVAAEGALVQDDTLADFSKGSLTRFFCLDPSQLVAPREYIYPISPVEQLAPQEEALDRGVSEILAIPRSLAPDFSFEPWMLVLERGTTLIPAAPSSPRSNEGTYRSQVDLFLTQLKDASNVSHLPSIRTASYRALKKTLALNFQSQVSQFTPGFQSVDNLEALTWGPRLKNGSPTLLILSDNNFNPHQRTQILAYEWRLR